MSGNEDSFGGESGLLDDYDALILDAWFATDARINNSQTLCLFWKMQVTVDGEVSEEEIEEFWPCGPDWVSNDGGETAEHPKGKKKYNNASKIQRMIGFALETGVGETLAARGTAMDAGIWKGLRFHMNRGSYEYTFKGEKGSAEILAPSAFLGTEDAPTNGGGSPGTPASSAAQPSTAGVLASLELSDETVAALKEAKVEAGDSHNAFVDKVMELTAVTSNANLVVAIADPNGLWKEL